MVTPSLFERIRDRVRQELGGGDSGSFGERVRRLVRKRLSPTEDAAPEAPPEAPPEEPPYRGPPRSLAEVNQRIQEAGRKRVLLRMLYNGVWRDVEPYSYRYRDADDPHIPLLYGWCVTKDDQIEAYKLKKIEDLQVTNRPYNPRFVVEF